VGGALSAAEKVRSAVEHHHFDGDLRLTVSIGVASCPRDGSTLDDLVKHADDAMYQAKSQGKNRVVSA
jgi:diguanylate cyclase (GGDEF)-like protein